MEGPLSKWTNLVKGWQYRWFVLNMESGLLSYYTSKDKMKRGERRGCVKLSEAQVGIDDEDDSTFTITVDHKTFHFQARDWDERKQWIEAIENCKNLHNSTFSQLPGGFLTKSSHLTPFERKIAEANAYLQMLLEQQQKLDDRLLQCDPQNKEVCDTIRLRIKNICELVKQTIVCLQHAQHGYNSAAAVRSSSCKQPKSVPSPNLSLRYPTRGENDDENHSVLLSNAHRSFSSQALSSTAANNRLINPNALPPPSTVAIVTSASAVAAAADVTNGSLEPQFSYSSSDEEYFDTTEDVHSYSPSRQSAAFTMVEAPLLEETPKIIPSGSCGSSYVNNIANSSTFMKTGNLPLVTVNFTSSSNNANHFPLDELYDEADEEDLGNVQQHGSVILYLIGQLRIGMDLTKIALPTFILEKRSTLEMYADFLAHADLWLAIGDAPTPQERLIACVRWYLSAFHAGRRSSVAKKPYNPILGEIFQCFWDVSGEGGAAPAATTSNTTKTKETKQNVPVPWAPTAAVVFVAEQVSHHPPISAFYAEHRAKHMSVNGYIWTKSKFLGLSLSVEMVGQTVISLLDLNEEYTLSFPCGYGRNILNVPWIELGGKVSINCPKTGYYANVEFRTKPFYGGKRDQIRSDLFAPQDKKPFLSIEGEWNGKMYAKWPDGKQELFVDTKSMPVLRKQVKPRSEQKENESRRLWQDVTLALKEHNIEAATNGKSLLEQRQRDEAKHRAENNIKWETKLFHEEGQHWVYNNPLVHRLQKR